MSITLTLLDAARLNEALDALAQAFDPARDTLEGDWDDLFAAAAAYDELEPESDRDEGEEDWAGRVSG
jgi:hypothetical protein